jgi:hypothetical protein
MASHGWGRTGEHSGELTGEDDGGRHWWWWGEGYLDKGSSL